MAREDIFSFARQSALRTSALCVAGLGDLAVMEKHANGLCEEELAALNFSLAPTRHRPPGFPQYVACQPGSTLKVRNMKVWRHPEASGCWLMETLPESQNNPAWIEIELGDACGDSGVVAIFGRGCTLASADGSVSTIERIKPVSEQGLGVWERIEAGRAAWAYP